MRFRLNKQNWSKKDIEQYKKYCLSLKSDPDSCNWEKRIINTKLDCFGKTSTKAKIIVQEIKKGNYIQFLDLLTIKNHLDSIVYAHLLNQIKDFSIYKKYLSRYVKTIDNWASCDTLKFNKHKYHDLQKLAQTLLKSKQPFIKRVAINIYFELIHDPKYLIQVFNLIDSLKNEQHYYVNMVAAWLLCECFAKYRNQTLNYFKSNKTNAFIINKAISKCRDSYRVSKPDKDLLLKYKK